MDYKDTLNLPKTEFSMRANLQQNEPKWLASWEEKEITKAIREKNAPCPTYTLHAGPPYANGNIHIGHALNKILKDIIVKSKNMAGFQSIYIPGWDCHGLPIEHQVDKSLGKKQSEVSQVEKRGLCREYAAKYIDIQREEFKRLGVFGEWDTPYLTMDHGYEATIVREFGRIVEHGSVYRGYKPVHWCASCRTALAEAEVEYGDHKSPSVYVKFPLLGNSAEYEGLPVSILIWTTTPWTLPANLAIALHPEFDYIRVRTGDEIIIVARDLLETVMQVTGAGDYTVLGEPFKGKTMEGARCRHPFIERESVVILGEHVTLEQGTGCVHTAPGHGQEDYEMGLRYGLDIFTPVDDLGRYNEGFEKMAGTKVFAANPLIIQIMQENGSLVYSEEISHSYPHCWRCKKPVIFRATQQWFITMDHKELRKKSLEEIGKVQWIPAWGKERIYGMVENRPDWCISRQRSWGVPIVAFNCTQCKEVLLSPGVISHVAKLIEADGVDIWFSRQASELIPEGTQCSKCGGNQFEKESDILDVWFDSGVSHAAVIESQAGLGWPADLYLEGSDQHRGWFHSSLLTSVATRDRAPYKAVLTHGFTVDGKGKKMSKSLGNVIKPQKLIERYGAEIIRLWVAAEDYRDDVRISEEILKRLVEAYRRIRNTCRFMLGNLYDFDPADAVAYDALPEIDRWALHRLQTLIDQVRKAYDKFEFHTIFHAFYNFCNVDMSAFYLDVLKDRLYVSAANSSDRRAAQTVLYQILHSITRLMAPILSFTAEEVWHHLTDSGSVFVEDLPTPDPALTNKELGQCWERILKIRGEVTKVLEEHRREKTIGSSLDATVTLFVSQDLSSFLSSYVEDLADIFIVSASELRPLAESPATARESEEIPGLKILVQPATGEKCERCWMKKESVGKNRQYLTLCTRCVEVMQQAI